MSSSPATTRLVRWIVAAMIILAVVIAGGVMLASAQHGTNGSSVREAPSAAPVSPTVKPTSVSTAPAAPQNVSYDCQTKLTSAQYADFVKRLFQFEAIYLMSPSDERTSKLAPYSTKDYLKTQISIPIESTPSQSVQLQANSVYGCFMDDPDTITAYVTPAIDIVNGAGNVQKKGLVLSTHYTQWIKVNDIWYVNQEKN